MYYDKSNALDRKSLVSLSVSGNRDGEASVGWVSTPLFMVNTWLIEYRLNGKGGSLGTAAAAQYPCYPGANTDTALSTSPWVPFTCSLCPSLASVCCASNCLVLRVSSGTALGYGSCYDSMQIARSDDWGVEAWTSNSLASRQENAEV